MRWRLKEKGLNLFGKGDLKKLEPVLKWPPPPPEDDDMKMSVSFAKELGLVNGEEEQNKRLEMVNNEKPAGCPDCGKHPGFCICNPIDHNPQDYCSNCGNHICICDACDACERHYNLCICNETCDHKRKRNMSWPDGGHSEVCETCLKTRHLTEQDETEWQDHKYKNISDWYKEAFEVELRIQIMMG